MDWSTFVGHQRQQQWIRNAIANNRLASTFLFVGPDGIGKRTFARLIAKTLLCTVNEPAKFSPCNACESCAQIDASTHPDLIELSRQKDKTALSMDQLVGEGEMRMRDGLCYEIRMRPFSGRRKIAIIDDADTLAVEGANALLKTLEEPPVGAMIFLISTSAQRQLPTIRSRCQLVQFQPLPNDQIAQLLLRNGTAESHERALEIANQSRGSLAFLESWTDDELRSFRESMLFELGNSRIDFPKLSKAIVGHLDSVGTEGQLKRERLKLLIDAATQFYQKLLRRELNSPSESSNDVSSSRDHRTDVWVHAIKRCIEAREHVDRMVTPAALVESWLADLVAMGSVDLVA